jgi:hypothetical protein
MGLVDGKCGELIEFQVQMRDSVGRKVTNYEQDLLQAYLEQTTSNVMLRHPVDIKTVRTDDNEDDSVVTFVYTVEKSGSYLLHVTYNGEHVGSSYCPTLVYPSAIVHCSVYGDRTVTAGCSGEFIIELRDRYGNITNIHEHNRLYDRKQLRASVVSGEPSFDGTEDVEGVGCEIDFNHTYGTYHMRYMIERAGTCQVHVFVGDSSAEQHTFELVASSAEASPEHCLFSLSKDDQFVTLDQMFSGRKSNDEIRFLVITRDRFGNKITTNNQIYKIWLTRTVHDEDMENKVNGSVLCEYDGFYQFHVRPQWSGIYELCITLNKEIVTSSLLVQIEPGFNESTRLLELRENGRIARQKEQERNELSRRMELERKITAQVKQWTSFKSMRQILNEITKRYQTIDRCKFFDYKLTL